MPILSSLGNLKNRFKDIGLWQKKDESAAGIDIGSSSIKAVQLRKEKERAVLETYGELSLSRYVNAPIGQAVRLTDEKIMEAIRDLKKEAGIKAKKTIVSIPLRHSFLTKINLPLMSEAELEKAIPFEVKRHIPVPVSEVVFGWQIISFPENNTGLNEKTGMPKKQFTEILLVAVYKDFIEKYKSIIKAAGFETIDFEIEVFSVSRSLIYREPKPVLIIDLGAAKTKMTVIENGILKNAHDFDRGFQDLTLSLSRSLSVDFARAEGIKREIGLSNRPEHNEIKSSFDPILNYIFGETERLIGEYRRKEGNAITKAYLSGGGSLLKGLPDFAVNKLGIETKLGDPFMKVEYPSLLEETLNQVGPIFATAVGLALKDI